MAELGYYDSVRAGADTELMTRAEIRFGRTSVGGVEKLLSFMTWQETSLTGGGVFAIAEDGSFSSVRNEYRRNFMEWHSNIRNRQELYVAFPAPKRHFSVPTEIVP